MSITEFEILRDFTELVYEYYPLEFDPNDPYIDEFTEEFPEGDDL